MPERHPSRFARCSRCAAAALVLAAIGACRAPASERAPSRESLVTAPRASDSSSAARSPDAAAPAAVPAPARAIAIARFAAGDVPAYPEISRRLGEEGTVGLRLEVLPNGDVQSLRVEESSGYPRLDEAALAAARTWTFNPRTGVNDLQVIRHRIVFRLEGG